MKLSGVYVLKLKIDVTFTCVHLSMYSEAFDAVKGRIVINAIRVMAAFILSVLSKSD